MDELGPWGLSGGGSHASLRRQTSALRTSGDRLGAAIDPTDRLVVMKGVRDGAITVEQAAAMCAAMEEAEQAAAREAQDTAGMPSGGGEGKSPEQGEGPGGMDSTVAPETPR
jgi:hypothetical protein